MGTYAEHPLLPLRVAPCEVPRLLQPVLSGDLFGLAEDEALRRLLAAARGPEGPGGKPVFPPGGQACPVWPAAMTDIHQGSTVYFSHQAQSDSGTIASVQQPNKLIVTGLQHAFDVGSTVSFTVRLPVTDANGNRLSFGHASGRFFSKIVTAMVPLGIGYIMAGFTAKKQALHDFIASTLVIKTN